MTRLLEGLDGSIEVLGFDVYRGKAFVSREKIRLLDYQITHSFSVGNRAINQKK